jgi:hypothetical protein
MVWQRSSPKPILASLASSFFCFYFVKTKKIAKNPKGLCCKTLKPNKTKYTIARKKEAYDPYHI